MRVYISGPVTGMPDLNLPAFERAADLATSLGKTPLVPHWFVPAGASWEEAMRRCVETLAKADELWALPGWRESRGARIEVALAKELGIECMEVGAARPAEGREGRVEDE